MTDESEWEDRQQMGVSDNTHRSQQQRPRSPLHCWGEGRGIRGVMGEEGEEEVVGVLVGKNQTGPNYRNHNESVSRETLLPGKHRGICVHSWTHSTSKAHTYSKTHTQNKKRRSNMHRCYKSAHIHTHTNFCFTVFCKGTHIVAHFALWVHMHTHFSPNQVWILIISLARPVWNYCSHLLMDEKTWSEQTHRDTHTHTSY